MESLIRVLTQKGYRVAAVKHDGHDFEPDVPGTDSWAFTGWRGHTEQQSSRIIGFLVTKEQEKRHRARIVFAFSRSRHYTGRGLKVQQLSKVCL